MDLLNFAYNLLNNNKLNEAEKVYFQIIEKNPNNFEALKYLGTIQLMKKNFLGSINYFEKSLTIKQEDLVVYNNLGLAYGSLGQLDNAINFYNKALDIDFSFINSINNKLQLLYSNKKIKEAQIFIDDFLKKKKYDFNTLNTIGIILAENKNYDQSIFFFKKSLEKNKNFTDPYLNIGISLVRKNNFFESLNFLLEMETKFSNHVTFNNIISVCYMMLNNIDKALLYAKKAIEINENDLNSNVIIFEIYLQKNDFFNGKIFLKKINILIDTEPKKKLSILSLIISFKQEFCYWEKLDEDIKCLKDFDQNKKGFSIEDSIRAYCGYHVYFMDDPDYLKQYAINYSNFTNVVYEKKIPSKSYNKKINIVYVSGDFRSHAMMYLMKDIFKFHDKSKFNIFAFSNNKFEDHITDEIKPYFKKFYNIHALSDKEVFKLAQLNEIDIAIDLNGYTKFERVTLFYGRLAPKQINFLGYAGTMGHKNYDYLIADKFIINDDLKKFYTENILYMPNIYQPNSTPGNKEFENLSNNKLKDKKFIFSAFHRSIKITPKILNCWIEIIKNAKYSKLLIGPFKDSCKKNLLKYFIEKGIETSQFEFVERLNINDHYNRIKNIDLGLDTYPYNGHTTTSDFLKNYTPILTLCGKSFQSRVSGSLLSQFSLEELITYNYTDYVDKAIAIYNNKDLLEGYKFKINQGLNMKLFDIKKYTKDLENIFESIMK